MRATVNSKIYIASTQPRHLSSGYRDTCEIDLEPRRGACVQCKCHNTARHLMRILSWDREENGSEHAAALTAACSFLDLLVQFMRCHVTIPDCLISLLKRAC
jgi:hypothetical protein